IIAKMGSISVSELSRQLGVSVVTIRKDLEVLESDNSVTRTYGGVIHGSKPIQEEIPELPKFSAQVIEAAGFIAPGQTIMLGGGKHIVSLADYIKNYENLTVITISIEVALTLMKAPHIDVILTGGILRARTMTMLGFLTERVIKEIAFDISFSEADGIHPQNGITSANMVEASTESTLLKYSNRPIILAEAGAIGRSAPVQISKLKPELTIILEGELERNTLKELESSGTQVIIPATASNHP
ncbi:MAG TPA: DeoR/GlpR family DNA-binding transcription regulator, partial [Bacillota bacterium]